MILANYPGCVQLLSDAIKVAEGSNPKWNNPGDLTYDFGYPTLGRANDEGVLIFQNAEDGLAALMHQVSLMLSGKSHVYKLTDTLYDVGLKYSGGDPNWARNVANYLNVTEETTLAELCT